MSGVHGDGAAGARDRAAVPGSSPTSVPAAPAVTDPLVVAPVLVRDYRRLLRLFPYAYRREHEAEMLGHLLDAARPGQSRPSRPERWDLLRAAARERLLAPLGSTARGRRASTGLLLVVLPALLVIMAARAVAFGIAWAGALLGPGGASLHPQTVTSVLMWVLWLVALAATLAGARRLGLVVAWAAGATGVVTLGTSLAAGDAYAAYLELPWVLAVLAYAGVLAARPTCRVGREARRPALTTLAAAVLVLGAYVAVTFADSVQLGVPWWSGVALRSWTPQALVAVAVLVLGAALWGRRTRQAVPVLAGLAVAALLSRSAFFWSGRVDPATADLGNVLGLLGFAVAATLVVRWVVDRLDELSEARAAHRAELAAVGGLARRDADGPGKHPGEPTAV